MNVIDLSWRYLRPKSILSILKNMEEKEKEKITSLDLQGNFLCIDGLFRLFHFIKNNFKSITHFNLSSTHLSSQEFFIVCSQIKELKYLNSIHLSYNNIMKRSISYLEPILPQLVELNLSSNYIKSKGIYLLISSFSKMKQLKRFSLKNCRLYNKDLFLIAENIGHLQSLEYLSLEGNYCNSTVFSYLLSELPKENLKYLNVSDICIFYMETELFSNKLQYTSFLSSQLELCLNLEILIWNMYYDFHIMKGIEKLQQLKKLVLSINVFFDEIRISSFPYLKNLEYLKISCIHTKTLESILLHLPDTIKTLSFNSIISYNYNIYQLLEIKLKQLKLLKSFEISHSSVNSFIIKNLCKSLLFCSNLQTISFSNNIIDDRGVYYLSFLFNYLKKLHTIDLSNNLITNIGVKIIIHSLCYKKNKIHCILDNNFILYLNHYFQEFITLFHTLKEKLKYSHYWSKKEEEIYSTLKLFYPFSHTITSISLQDKDDYNHSLFEIKKIINQKKNYFLFNSFIEKTNHYHSFFYNKDLQYLIQEYL